MTPRSRALLLAAAVLAASTPAFASSDWIMFEATVPWAERMVKKALYIKPADRAKFEQLRKGEPTSVGSLHLYGAPRAGEPAIGTLTCAASSPKPICQVQMENSREPVNISAHVHSTDASSRFFTNVAPGPGSAAEPIRPPGMSDPDWEIIDKSGLPDEEKRKAARALMWYRASNKADKIPPIAATPPCPPVIVSNACPQRQQQLRAAAAEHQAHLDARGPGPVPTTRHRFAEPPLPNHLVEREVPATGTQFTTAAEALKTEPKRNELKAAIEKLIKGEAPHVRPDALKYIKLDGVPAERREEVANGLTGAIARWVTEATANEAGLTAAGQLHLMLTKQEAPWPTLRERFHRLLEPYTVGAAGERAPGAPDPVGPFTGNPNWVKEFLDAAAAAANKAWRLQNVPDRDIPGLLGAGPDAPRDDGTRRGPGIRFGGRDYDVEALYGRGGVVVAMPIPGTDLARRISMKMYTEIDSYGPPPTYRQMLGIFDITEPPKSEAECRHLRGQEKTDCIQGDMYGQYFEVKNGEATIRIDDRRRDTVAYRLAINNGNISLQVMNTLETPPRPLGRAVQTSQTELFEMRNEQVRREGYAMTIGGANYQCMGQGGFPYGSTNCFLRGANGALSEQPMLSALTTRMGPNGELIHAGNTMSLGHTADGKARQIRWNAQQNRYEIIEAQGPLTAPPSPTGRVLAPGDLAQRQQPAPGTPGTPGSGQPTTVAPAARVEANVCSTDGIGKQTTGSFNLVKLGELWHLCLHGKYLLFTGGLAIGAGDVERKDDNLIVRTFTGRGAATVDQAKQAEIRVTGTTANGGGLTNATVQLETNYYISISGAGLYTASPADLQTRLANRKVEERQGGVFQMRLVQMAWARRKRGDDNDTSGHFEINLVPGMNVKGAVAKGMQEWGKSSICTDAANLTANTAVINAYVDSVLAHASVKAIWDEYEGQDQLKRINWEPPYLVVNCKGTAGSTGEREFMTLAGHKNPAILRLMATGPRVHPPAN